MAGRRGSGRRSRRRVAGTGRRRRRGPLRSHAARDGLVLGPLAGTGGVHRPVRFRPEDHPDGGAADRGAHAGLAGHHGRRTRRTRGDCGLAGDGGPRLRPDPAADLRRLTPSAPRRMAGDGERTTHHGLVTLGCRADDGVTSTQRRNKSSQGAKTAPNWTFWSSAPCPV
ncbi:hypothetical protein ACFFX0_00665 [Citricoccus parietis]|uniref:Uncharacterized protein n=1 Tax=Citricoccus parietis TaxID=592307 RepID=A0ABV5FSX7_9MICC